MVGRLFEEVRAAGAERKAEHDERKRIAPLRNGEDAEEEPVTSGGETPWEDNPDAGELKKRRDIFLKQASAALGYGQVYDGPVDDHIIQVATACRDTWADMVRTLEAPPSTPSQVIDRCASLVADCITNAINRLEDDADQRRLIETLEQTLLALKVVHEGGAVELPSRRAECLRRTASDADAAASAEAMKAKFAAIEQEVKDVNEGGKQTHFGFMSQSIAAPIPVLGDDPGPMPECLRRTAS
jgi:hypothetical protein